MKRGLLTLLALFTLLIVLTGCGPLQEQTDSVTGRVVNDPLILLTGEPIENTSIFSPSNTPAESTEDTATDRPIRRFLEGDLIQLQLQGEDPDGDRITYTFSSPLNSNGEWQSQRGDAGQYPITITATDGEANASQDILLIIESVNKAPILRLDSKIITVNAGEQVTINANAEDPDGDPVNIAFTGWMSGASRETTADDEGSHSVTVTATDGEESVSETVTIVVEHVNTAPVIKELSTIVVTEGEMISAKPEVSDGDGDLITFTYGEPLNSNGEWQTQKGDVGEYVTIISASDGELEDIITVNIVVLSANQAPIITLNQASVNVEEGERITLDFSVEDPDGDQVTTTISGFMTKESYTTTFDDEGNHKAIITATDGKHTVSEEVAITVRNKNRAPVFSIN